MVFVKALNEIITQALGIIGGVYVQGEIAAVVFIKSVLGCEPQEPFAILKYAIDRNLRETVFGGDAVEFIVGGLRKQGLLTGKDQHKEK